MDDVLLRLAVLIRVLVPFVLFMASVYLALHMLVARVVRRPDSQILWFFAVVTGPLTRPVRGLLPPGTAEARVRLMALALYVGLWVASGAFLRWLVAPGAG
jgi:uncharacterized protein YggT (Ycf19 family)